jgi:tetratricopeptide (TPR) repeat protein
MFEALDQVKWSTLSHAYGDASDVPGLLRALGSPRPAVRQEALWGLFGNIVHQGTRYEASPHAVPFLLELLAAPGAREASGLMGLLVALVAAEFAPGNGPALCDGVRVVRGDAEEPLPKKLGAELKPWLACYRAAELGLPTYLRWLAQGKPPERMAAAHLLGLFQPRAAAVVPALEAQLRAEPEAPVRAMLAFSLSQLQPRQASPSALLAQRVADDPAPVVRLVAALGLLQQRASPLPEGVRAALDAALAQPAAVAGYDRLPWSGDGLVGDVGRVLARLPPEEIAPFVPGLLGALPQAQAFGHLGVGTALLRAAFGPAHELPEDPESDRAPDAPRPTRDMAALTALQRQVLEAFVARAPLWQVGNLMVEFDRYQLPSFREELAQALGLAVDPHDASTLLTQGRDLLDVFQDPEQALAVAMRAQELAPASAEAAALLGRVQLELGEEDEALASLSRAIELDPAAWRPHFDRAMLHFRQGSPESLELAQQGFQQALEAGCPERTQVTNNRAVALAHLGRRGEGIALEQALVEERPDDARGWYQLGLSLVKASRHAESIAALTRAAGLDDEHAETYYARACALALTGKQAEALADLTRGLELKPEMRDDIRDDEDFRGLRAVPEFVALTTDAAQA